MLCAGVRSLCPQLHARKIMLTQQEWVEGCYAYYAENGYEPGNPEDGIWEDAHYPVPKCEGGSETIKLLKQHHAVQGVLQSEEYQRPCIWGWEADYLEGEMLALCKKWHQVKSRNNREAWTPEKRGEAARKARERRAAQSPEQRSEIARKAQAARTPEMRREAALRSAAAQTLEQRSEARRRARARMTPEAKANMEQKRQAAWTPEKRAEAARRTREQRAAQAAMLRDVTGH